MGAMSEVVGYVGVDDIDAAADRIKRLGGAVYVPPTDSNIGRISVVADPQTAALIWRGLKHSQSEPAELGELDRVAGTSCSPLVAKRSSYSDLFGWRKWTPIGSTDRYQLFATGGRRSTACSPSTQEPVPFWLYYFNVEDLAATARDE